MASTQQQLNEARQAFQSLQAEVQTLRTLLEQQQSTIQTRTATQPKPRLPDPKEFDGKAYRFDT